MTRKLVGLIPAAGRASRLGPLPCSKEILPVGISAGNEGADGPRLVTAIDCSLLAFADAGIESAFVVISSNKEDIRRYLGKSPVAPVQTVFEVVDDSPSIVVSLSRPFERYRDDDVALLFPDIILEPGNLLVEMKRQMHASGCDIVLGLMPTDRGDKMDIVQHDRHGAALSIEPKPGPGISGDTWIAAIWNPRFSAYLNEKASMLTEGPTAAGAREIHIGDVVQAAIEDGLAVFCHRFPDGECHDIGTLPDYRNHWRRQ